MNSPTRARHLPAAASTYHRPPAHLRLVATHGAAAAGEGGAAALRHRQRAHFWRIALPGLALFWTAAGGLVLSALL